MFLALLLAVSLASAASATIRYTVSLEHPERHIFHVTMEIPTVAGDVTVQMPAWNALYQIRDFSAHVREVEAFAGSEKIPLEKIDKQTWHIAGKGTIALKYATYWDEPGPFATQLNTDHAFLNPPIILMYLPNRPAAKAHTTIPRLPF